MRVSAQYADEHFTDLLAAADRGEEVEIARPDKPTLRLVLSPLERDAIEALPTVESRSKLFGIARGSIWIADDFDSPEVNDEIATEFEGSEIFDSSPSA